MKSFLFLTLSFFLIPSCAPRFRTPLPVAKSLTFTPSNPFLLPLPHAQLLSPFGPRGRRFHTGWDLQRNKRGGDNILASREGKVLSAKRSHGYGNLLTIFHQDGSKTRYAHLKSFKVKTGEWVKTQQLIGIVGQTGRASTPHLHFEIITPDGKFIDPEYLIRR